MEHFIHKEQKITNDTRQHEQLATLKISFIDNLVQNLHARFPDNDWLSAFSIFDTQKLPVLEEDHGCVQHWGITVNIMVHLKPLIQALIQALSWTKSLIPMVL